MLSSLVAMRRVGRSCCSRSVRSCRYMNVRWCSTAVHPSGPLQGIKVIELEGLDGARLVAPHPVHAVLRY